MKINWIKMVIWVCWLQIAAFTAHSQNLVPNPSFELENCPTGYTGFPTQVATWIQNWYSANCASPDPMTNCSSNANTSIPDVWFGHQYARTGDNYMGISFYGSWYEYVGVQLSSPLVAGETYNVSFWVSCAEQARFASDAVGVYLSNTQVICPGGFSGTMLTFTPQVVQPSGVFLTDTARWVCVKGDYTAVGGEKYITLGCFKAWNTATLHDFGAGQARCYYYVDDVSVERISLLPVELLSFDAVINENNEVDLHWETVFEEKAYSHEIQRSKDAIDFETIGTVNAVGNIQTTTTYQYTDKTPNHGIAYYRLKLLDYSGDFTFSKIVSVENPTQAYINYNNPVQDELIVSLDYEHSLPITLSLFNINGEILYNSLVDGYSCSSILFSSYAKGVYILAIQLGESKTIYKKIIKL